MDKILSTIVKIENVENLHLITFDCGQTILKMVSLELANNISIGKRVVLNYKSSSVVIAKNFYGDISFANKLKCKVIDIKVGKLLSIVELQCGNFHLESMSLSSILEKMSINKDDEITAFIKVSDISILEVIDE